MNNKNRWELHQWPYIIFAGLFIVFFGFVFKWGHALVWKDPNYIVNDELFGTFGDFVGGVLGTIFTIISVIILAKTFAHQQDVTTDNEIVLKTQRFNDLFFELLHLYQSEVNELCGYKERVVNVKQNVKTQQIKVQKEGVQYNNKDFFDEEKLIIQERYRNQMSFEKNKRRAVGYYMLFYTKNRSKISAYYRTLYRIYELIDKSDLLSELQKKEYAKMIRAQLTESELFFIRYNAMTIYGQQFIYYINKYNILKNLPAFELLEFKDWWERMNIIEREGTNIIYYAIRKTLKETFKKCDRNGTLNALLFPDNTSKYQISISCHKRIDVEFRLTINHELPHYTNEYSGITKLDHKKIQQLLDCWIKEIFIHSNFSQYNNEENIQTYSLPIITEEKKTIINSGIKNIKFEELHIVHVDKS